MKHVKIINNMRYHKVSICKQLLMQVHCISFRNNYKENMIKTFMPFW